MFRKVNLFTTPINETLLLYINITMPNTEVKFPYLYSWCWSWNILSERNWCHACWCPDSSQGQFISSNGIDCASKMYSCLPWMKISTKNTIPLPYHYCVYSSAWWLFMLHFLVLKPVSFWQNRLMRWLLMPRHLLLLGHQKQWYWWVIAFNDEWFKLPASSECKEIIEKKYLYASTNKFSTAKQHVKSTV